MTSVSVTSNPGAAIRRSAPALAGRPAGPQGRAAALEIGSPPGRLAAPGEPRRLPRGEPAL
jgi:hypothetical protein